MELRKLSILFASIFMMSLLGQAAHAVDVGEEIPSAKGDLIVRVQPTIDHIVYFTKIATCEGKEIAIMYQMISGYSRGSKFVGTCHPLFRDSVATCEMDNSKFAKTCYNKVIDHFQLGDRYEKIAIEKINLDAAPVSAPAAAASNVSR